MSWVEMEMVGNLKQLSLMTALNLRSKLRLWIHIHMEDSGCEMHLGVQANWGNCFAHLVYNTCLAYCNSITREDLTGQNPLTHVHNVPWPPHGNAFIVCGFPVWFSRLFSRILPDPLESFAACRTPARPFELNSTQTAAGWRGEGLATP